ncbi:hypothetical protein BpHYR1_051894 [Brachionus plicatilis]|uniref:Uncharacterized protein n=1 Tax=Brachionus plicatilis TaxID=10195 RepID=A0A3M7RLX5_BRAPC|nr:hypothetical protein BpHYR1_051894 [Brachionus plicatilis]
MFIIQTQKAYKSPSKYPRIGLRQNCFSSCSTSFRSLSGTDSTNFTDELLCSESLIWLNLKCLAKVY